MIHDGSIHNHRAGSRGNSTCRLNLQILLAILPFQQSDCGCGCSDGEFQITGKYSNLTESGTQQPWQKDNSRTIAHFEEYVYGNVSMTFMG